INTIFSSHRLQIILKKLGFMFRTAALLFFTSILTIPSTTLAQTTDSISNHQEIIPVNINAYFSQQPLLGLTATVQTIDSKLIENQQTTTLLPALNTVAGLRMEERSPGSYRLAMRGSLIRSP